MKNHLFGKVTFFYLLIFFANPALAGLDGHDYVLEESYINELADAEWVDSIDPFACIKASVTQLSVVNLGSNMNDQFINECRKATSNSRWCEQLTRPNPASISTFRCTYGSSQMHRLIHPNKNTWKYAFRAVGLIRDLEAKGISVAQIYNWWRPQPYNKNVGGAAGRHPYGTSVDVRFSSTRDMEKAHKQLCTWRRQGKLRALGYYGSTGLHFGIGDTLANTWGKSCNY